jgi:hypothetical protein
LLPLIFLPHPRCLLYVDLFARIDGIKVLQQHNNTIILQPHTTTSQRHHVYFSHQQSTTSSSFQHRKTTTKQHYHNTTTHNNISTITATLSCYNHTQQHLHKQHTGIIFVQLNLSPPFINNNNKITLSCYNHTQRHLHNTNNNQQLHHSYNINNNNKTTLFYYNHTQQLNLVS